MWPYQHGLVYRFPCG